MAEGGNPVVSSSWSVADIVYVTIISPLVLAAFLEWFLWIAAFLYCLFKVYQKADHWSVRFLAVTMMILFTSLRGIFLPVMIVTLPLPAQMRQYVPSHFASALQWFAFGMFSALLIIPWLLCIYRLVTHSPGRTKRVKQILDDHTAPKTVVVMPVYKEAPETLIRAINSVVDCDYPANCIHVFLSYDGCNVDESYLRVIDHLGIPISLESYPQSIDVTYKGARITVSRFKHGGKRHCQKQTFRLIDKVYAEYLKRHDNLFVLFIDSDCILDRVCLQNFMYDMELKPGSKRSMLAMTGVITSTTEKTSLLTLLQDMEYVHGQLFERSMESTCGAVTCLPGALTILRFSAFRKMAKYYFADKAEQCEDLFDYGKCHLGEDRWLTHLFMIGAQKRYQIQMCASAFCKTEAVQTFGSLLKQRRRWFLGFITNEVCMLTDVRLWKRYPLLCLVRFMQNTIRTTALLFFIIVLSIITTSSSANDLPVGFIAISLGLNYLLMFYLGAKLKRYKAWLFPVMFILNPFFNWLYMIYGILTAGQRTWGGPRTDAATADEHTSPEEAVEQARAQGDELNVDLTTFRSRSEEKTVPIHPSEKIEGRFSAALQLPDGYYDHGNDSGATLTDLMMPLPKVPRIGIHSQFSSDSVTTLDSMTSIHLPLKVEDLISDDDRVMFQPVRQARDPTESPRRQPEHVESDIASGQIIVQQNASYHLVREQSVSSSSQSLPHVPQSAEVSSSDNGDLSCVSSIKQFEQEPQFAPINPSTRGSLETNFPERRRSRRKLPGIPRPIQKDKGPEHMV
ncbi:chitin synthase D [Aspergillus clavatus NRRL 1]|uniref:chitin synthase n=1 Tax=Aspergillus clavatus (strain ATCC 1007 / CBS 513.65 / DSM 816 / NCTC 3887 / NRRL 1 / QM 1276 / 107) TaxID=344612 RepID=A1CPK1_ASPCL|nr:chitin synthase D [Aspergillus clavatus NRRL 1]EAW07572.1 chitin synthase D [Aspergillus clavatus NRRL 1]